MKSIDDAVSCIKSRLPHTAVSVGIISGSGWNLRALLDTVTEIGYKDITGFPLPSAAGHIGMLICGSHNGKTVILLQGRVHYYEGYGMDDVTFYVRVLSALGIKQVVFTNAAGGIRPGMMPGDFMVVTDHINLMGVNPLRGMGYPASECFTDMTEAYDKRLAGAAVRLAGQLNVKVHTGTLAAVAGPSYETPAEIRMLSTLGADAVCMSTVPDVILAAYLGMKVLAISVITNHAAGISASVLRHEDVVRMADSRSKDASRLISGVIDQL